MNRRAQAGHEKVLGVEHSDTLASVYGVVSCSGPTLAQALSILSSLDLNSLPCPRAPPLRPLLEFYFGSSHLKMDFSIYPVGHGLRVYMQAGPNRLHTRLLLHARASPSSQVHDFKP
jgi:hypothetical protein